MPTVGFLRQDERYNLGTLLHMRHWASLPKIQIHHSSNLSDYPNLPRPTRSRRTECHWRVASQRKRQSWSPRLQRRNTCLGFPEVGGFYWQARRWRSRSMCKLGSSRRRATFVPPKPDGMRHTLKQSGFPEWTTLTQCQQPTPGNSTNQQTSRKSFHNARPWLMPSDIL